MNKRSLGVILSYLLLCIVVLHSCNTQTTSQTGKPQALTIPAQQSGSATVLSARVEPRTNVTQQQYENALAKWYARAVLEYEITLIDSSAMGMGGKLRLHIKADSNEPRLVSYTDLNYDQPQIIPLETLTEDELDYLRGLSVEKMFRLLGMLFTGELANTSGLTVYYDVEFDPTLGYPIRVHSRAFPQGGAAVTDCCISYEVLSLRVLTSATSVPGMPRTGNRSP